MSGRNTKRPARLIHYPQAAVALAVWGLFRALPMDAASALGGALLRLIGPWIKPHRIAQRNLRRAFPEKSAAEIKAILRRMWDNLGRNLGELPHLKRIADPASGRMEVIGREHLEALRDDGKAGFCVGGHLGNWQLQPFAVGRSVGPLNVFYRAPNNPLVERIFQTAHGGAGGELLPKGREGARRSLELLRQGGHFGMLVDQKMNDGIPVPFFGRDAMTAPALAQLALRVNAPVVPVRIVRLDGHCRFRVEAEPPLDLPRTGDAKADVTEAMRRVNARLEAWIREYPEQWLWVHKRWPD